MAKKSITKPVRSNHKTTHKTAGHAALKAASADTGATEAKATPKKVSAALLETIEKRKKAQATAGKGGAFGGRPPGRRGRRPKRPVEYTPQNTEEGGEEGFDFETDNKEHIEYDTGIRVEKPEGDSGFSLEGYDFDEELNFDR